MSKFIIYEYNKQNKDLIVEELEARGYTFISIPLTDSVIIKTEDYPNSENGLLIDISMVVSDDERAILYSRLVENMMDFILQNHFEEFLYIIVNRRYTYTVNDLFGYRIEKVRCLESYFNVSIP